MQKGKEAIEHRDWLIAEFTRLRKGYKSVNAMVATLHRFAGFRDVNRVTIYRWFKKPARRAEIAIHLLSSILSGKQEFLIPSFANDLIAYLAEMQMDVCNLQAKLRGLTRFVRGRKQERKTKMGSTG